MKRLLEYIVLPREITPFEAEYLGKTNRVALWFFALHLPAFVFLAWINGTKPLVAAVLTSLVLAGPAIANHGLRNPRAISVVHGVTAMAMGGLLVHFGQGPVQIEMHFYFFALIAMLALFGNPLVILAAAGTVTVHHLALWFLMPKSVFNYEAPIWVVFVHAAFVVLEVVGSVFIARSFFDNVIGLEKIVRARTEQLTASERAQRIILDNVEQGFATIDHDGNLASGHSAALEAWFGLAEGANVFDLFARKSADFAERSRMGWDQVREGFMPLELTLDQMPRQLATGDRFFDVTYRPIGEAESPDRFLVIVADATATALRERAETERREAMKMFERMIGDRNGSVEFLEEASVLAARILRAEPGDPNFKRMVHTLKGNCALFGLESIARICHEIEDSVEQEGAPAPKLLGQLEERWSRVAEELERMLGDRVRVVQMDEAQHAALERALRERMPTKAVLKMVHELKLEPTQTRINGLLEQARRVAQRLNKEIDARGEGHDLRVDPKRWAGFWSAFVHAIRNAVDHGVEAPEDRALAGKPEVGTIAIETALRGDRFVVEIKDDGPGVDWDRVAERAAAQGLPHATREELQAALFSDGVSTASHVTDVSGRGVGMGALLAATEELGGALEIDSARGKGTTLRFTFPASKMAPELVNILKPTLPPAAA